MMAVSQEAVMLQDNSEVGIKAMLNRLSNLLNQVDPELWYHLTHKNKVRLTSHSTIIWHAPVQSDFFWVSF